MKWIFTLLLGMLCMLNASSQRELVLCTTGYGFDRNSSNGIDNAIWTYIQKWTSLTSSGQDASVTAVRLHVQWEQYEPTLGNYNGAKLAQAVNAIRSLKSGMKVALHFGFMRPGSMNDSYFGNDDIARLSDGTLAQESITFTQPSVYSQTARERFYDFVDDAISSISSYYNDILYIQMGNGSAEEFVIPVMNRGNGLEPAFYEQKALDSWRNEYLPCRYPNQSTVTWDGSTYNISSAPPNTNRYDWNSDIGREYHRFAGWGLMRLYKGFRDIVKSYNNNLKVLYFVSDFGNSNGNTSFLHSSTLPMGMEEMDGIYTSDGVGQYDGATKIRAVDVMKGTDPNKIAAIEFDPDDLGQVVGQNNINPNIASEWMPRAFKHGVNYIHFAMFYPDADINLLAPVLASLKSNYVNGSYSPPSRQSPVTVNIYPTVFTGTHLFSGAWNTANGSNWSSTDNNPVSIEMIDDGYWENVWSCSSSPDPCAFTMSASASTNNPAAGASITLTGSCNGQCSGVSYSWSGNGISGSSSTNTFNAPTTPGTYTYTVTGSKSGCSNKTANVVITVDEEGGGGETNFDVCLEAEDMSGTGAITQDPNASNGSTRGEENTSNHYVDYAINNVPCAGTFSVTLTYYSSSAPTVDVSVNGGSAQTINLSNSGSWNIVKTTHTFNVTLAAGNNTLRIAGASGGSCRQDKICVSGTCEGGGEEGGGEEGGGPFSQCLESESMSGTGAVTQDPNASNGSTRGEENNNNHYVDYAVTSVPSNGTYNVTLTYYSSSAPTIGVSVNGGTAQTINLANSGSWNIVSTTHTFAVTLTAGSNTIRISGTGGGSCRQDKICVANPSQALLDPESYDGALKLAVFPNPARGNVVANFYLEPGKRATLQLTDILGRTLRNQQIMGKGWHREVLALDNKASGMMLIRLVRENGVEVKKIRVMR